MAQLVARGLSNRAVAEALIVTERTAEAHVRNALGKDKASDEPFTQFETEGGGVVYVAADRVAYIEDVSSGPAAY